MSPPAGDQRHRAGLPAASAHGLPQCSPPTHAGLLAEGPQQPAQVQPDRQQPGQDDPQSQQPESNDPAVFWVRIRTQKYKHAYPSRGVGAWHDILKDLGVFKDPRICHTLLQCVSFINNSFSGKKRLAVLSLLRKHYLLCWFEWSISTPKSFRLSTDNPLKRVWYSCKYQPVHNVPSMGQLPSAGSGIQKTFAP